MRHSFQSGCIANIAFTWVIFFIHKAAAFPSGGPLSACSHLMPVHVDGEQQNSASPYVLILNDTTYGSYPVKLTVSAVGPGARDFMAFMLQARSEYGEPAGYFSGVPIASKTLTCYEKDDTLTHTAAFIRTAMEVVWHPPPKNIGKISITGSIALSKIKFWAVESNALTGTGEVDLSGAKLQVQQNSYSNSSGNGNSEGQGSNVENSAAAGVVSGAILPYFFLLPVAVKLLHL